jgi:hypothetical protein
MTMTTTGNTRGPLGSSDQGSLEAQVIDLIEKGANDAEIIKITHVALVDVRELRAAVKGTTAAPTRGVAIFQERADRRRCECGAFQAEHGAGGSGACVRTLCREFAPEAG